MTNYQRIQGGKDIFAPQSTFRCTDKTSSIHLGVPKRDVDMFRSNMSLYGDYCDVYWAEAEDAVEGMGDVTIPAKNIGADETIAFGFMEKWSSRIVEWLTKKYGQEVVENINTTFVPYMTNSIYNLLRLDVAYNHEKSPYQRTLFGKLRVLLVEKAIKFVVVMAAYGLAGNDTMATKWLVNGDNIKHYFPQVPERLVKIEDNGKRYDQGKSTQSLFDKNLI